METILEFQNVSYAYHTLDGETPALSHISFSVKKGEFIAIVGPSGCGKSTLLSLIAGLLQPEEGQILIHGKSVELRNANIGYMLQKDHLFEWRTIYSNVLLGLEIQKKDTPQKREQIDSLLQTYGLDTFKNSKPSQLSGGMRQRAALIRTLALEPDLLLLDEPFSALDYQTRLMVNDDVYKIIKNENKTAILVTHDISEAIAMSDRIAVLSKRPSTIKSEHKINFEDMEVEKTPFECRKIPEFQKYFDILWKEIDNNDIR